MLVAADSLLKLQEDDLQASIFLLTGGYSRAEHTDLDRIAHSLRNGGIGLNVVGCNFLQTGIIGGEVKDEEEEEEEVRDMRAVPDHKKANEAALRKLVREVNGRLYGLQEASVMLSQFRTRTVRQVPTFTGALNVFGASFQVKMFLKTKKASFPSFQKLSAYSLVMRQQNAADQIDDEDDELLRAAQVSEVFHAVFCFHFFFSYQNDDGDGDDDEAEEAGAKRGRSKKDPGVAAVKMERDYVGVIDPDKAYSRDNLVKGFRFGKTIVPLGGGEAEMMSYKTEQVKKREGREKGNAYARWFFVRA